MPLYRTQLGVLVDIPAEKAERNGGMIPVDSAPPARRKPPAKKSTTKKGED